MNYIKEQLAQLTLTQIMGHVIVLIGLLSWYYFMIWKRKEVFSDLRGKDGWQFWEGVAIFWLTFAPAILVGHLFGVPLSKDISMKDVWDFMQIVFLIAVAGKSSQKFIQARYGAPEKTETEVSIKKTEIKKQEPPLDEVEKDQ